jgi:subtilisin family serine protease
MAEAFTVHISSGAGPLHLATVALILEKGEQLLSELTDSQGRAVFGLPSSAQPRALIATPYAEHWEMLVYEPRHRQIVTCPPLPRTGPDGWWHAALNARGDFDGEGLGVRVGVVDTGCGPHPLLTQVSDVGAFLDGDHVTTVDAGADSLNHGTHVVGILAARPTPGGRFGGVARGLEVFSARAFGPDNVANQGDIANAIEWLVTERQVDLINLSLSSEVRSEVVHDAILLAREHGTLCLCAVGNSGGAVKYPAALEVTVGVGAVGLQGWGVEGSMAAARVPEEPEKIGAEGFYLANFSASGAGVDVVGPGVGVISTVPARFGHTSPYAVMGGTSMACPAVVGALAVILASSPKILEMDRSPARAEAARSALRRHCRDIGLAAEYQGSGLPRIPPRRSGAG